MIQFYIYLSLDIQNLSMTLSIQNLFVSLYRSQIIKPTVYQGLKSFPEVQRKIAHWLPAANWLNLITHDAYIHICSDRGKDV